MYIFLYSDKSLFEGGRESEIKQMAVNLIIKDFVSIQTLSVHKAK